MAQALATGSWWRWLGDSLAGLAARHRLRGELAALAPEDNRRILADCGLSPADMRHLTGGHLHAAGLLDRMLAATGLDRGRLLAREPETLRDLQRVCTFCPAWRHCRRCLDDGSAARSYDSFCPNAPTLKALRAE